jgi:oligoendopeptidase F
MTATNYPEVWDLDVFFKGGSASPEFKQFIESISTKVDTLNTAVIALTTPISVQAAAPIREVLELIKDVNAHISHAGGVLSCLTAQDTTDREALLLQGKLGSISATTAPVVQKFHKLLTDTEAEVFEALLATEELQQFAFILTEWREQSRQKLSGEEEAIISALGVDGYHSWGQLYNLLIADIKVQVEVDGEVKTLSVGQANNLTSHKDAKVRKDAFEALEKVFTEKEEFFAKTLNHLGGFR